MIALLARDIRLALRAGGGTAVIATHADLGLPEPRVLRLAPLAARSAARHTEPFLAGDWA